MRQRFLLLIPALLTLAACGHTNRLAEYPIAGKRAVYRTSLAANAASSWVVVESPSKDATTNIIATIGSFIISDQARQKLERSVQRDSVPVLIAQGIRQATTDYLSLQEVLDGDPSADVIIETVVTDYSLTSGEYGLAVRARGNSRIIDRSTGVVVWENAEAHTIPLSETYLAPLGGRIVRSGASIFNAAKFFSLSEEELRQVIGNACIEAGREIGETLREDVAEIRTK